MSKLIPLDEAAGILGMTEDQVAELRSNSEIFGYRDGSTWKFKMSELERVADELGITLNVGGSAIDSVKGKIDDAVSELGLSLEESGDDLILDDDDAVDLLEDSSVELFSDSMKDSLSTSASSLKLDDLKLLDEDDDDSLKLGESSGILMSDSDKPAVVTEPEKSSDSINLSSSSIFDSDESLSFGGSSLKLGDDADKVTGGSDVLDVAAVDDASGSGTGKEIDDAGGDDLLLQSDDDLLLQSDDDLLLQDDDDDLLLQDSGALKDSADLSADFVAGSAGELSLDDSDSNMDLKLETDGSGIDLAISESGISLSSDEPLELGGSAVDALQLDDDDDDVIMVDEVADDDDSGLLQEDDFNLTPLEESSAVADSTSQVIAMEDSGIFADESVATVLGDGDFDAEVSDDSGFGDGFSDDGLGGDGLYEDAAFGASGTAVAAATVPDIEYSKWQLASLGLVSTLLLAGSLVAYDLARNLWMPDNQTVGRGVLKFFLGLVNMD